MGASDMDAEMWHVTTTRVHVTLTPKELAGNGKEAASRLIMDELLWKYSKRLDGVGVAQLDDIEFEDMAKFVGASPFAHVTGRVKILVFRAKKGMRMLGKVAHVGPDHVGMKVFGVFHGIVGIEEGDWRYEAGRWEGEGGGVGVGDWIRFVVENVVGKGEGLFQLRGKVRGMEECGVVQGMEEEMGMEEETEGGQQIGWVGGRKETREVVMGLLGNEEWQIGAGEIEQREEGEGKKKKKKKKKKKRAEKEEDEEEGLVRVKNKDKDSGSRKKKRAEKEEDEEEGLVRVKKRDKDSGSRKKKRAEKEEDEEEGLVRGKKRDKDSGSRKKNRDEKKEEDMVKSEDEEVEKSDRRKKKKKKKKKKKRKESALDLFYGGDTRHKEEVKQEVKEEVVAIDMNGIGSTSKSEKRARKKRKRAELSMRESSKSRKRRHSDTHSSERSGKRRRHKD